MNEDAGPKVLTGSFARAPWLLVVVAAFVAMTGLGMTFVGAGHTGLSADELAHVKRLESFYKDGLFVRNNERRFSEQGTIPPNAYVYAPATVRVMHVFNRLAGNEGPGEASYSGSAFIVRHYVVAAMSVLAVLSAFILAWMMLGSWGWGVVAAGALTAIPMWTGHAMFNPKDTPVAVGNTLMSVAIAGLVLAAARAGKARLLATGVATLAMIFGITLMVGTRPGMWPAVLGAYLTTLFILAVGRSIDRWVLLGLSAALVGSYAALWKLYPRIFSHPIAMLKASVGQSTTFPHGVTRGRSYVFERTAIEWPVLLLIFFLLGTVVAGIICLRTMRTAPRRSVAFGVVGVQAFALTIAVIATNANVYDGLRQLLFAVPAQALLATVGIATALTLARRGALKWMVASLAVAALVLPMIVQARLYPYQYAYGNVVAEMTGAHILNDNWKVSFGEYVEEVQPNVKAICPNLPPHDKPISRNHLSDCRGGWGPLKPPWLVHWHHARFDPDSPKFYTLLRSQMPVPSNCKVVDETVRYRNFERAVMSKLLLCTQEGVL
ncbi:MAG: hypothetical protein ACJ71Z_00550 [Aeromicrobium sp.]